nr:lysophospholipid acyltransferase family protein [Clostridium polynesiense]
MRTYLIMIYYGLFMVVMALRLLLIKIIRRIKGNKAAEAYKEKVVINWSRHTLKVTGMSYEAYGKENIPEGNCLYVSNHQSLFDIPLIIDAVSKPLGFVAKKELKKVPILIHGLKKLIVYI